MGAHVWQRKALRDDDEKFKLRVAALSDEQRSAIANALVTIRELRVQAERPRSELLDTALSASWSQYVANGPLDVR